MTAIEIFNLIFILLVFNILSNIVIYFRFKNKRLATLTVNLINLLTIVLLASAISLYKCDKYQWQLQKGMYEYQINK